jgi:hypothetical protein
METGKWHLFATEEENRDFRAASFAIGLDI